MGMGTDWSGAYAPSIDDVKTLAATAFAALPEHFRVRCANITFLVEDFADQDTLDALDIDNPFDLLGVYHGIDETRASLNDVNSDINRIILFRRPLLDYWAEHEETLGDLVTHVLVHEIGHHFGLSDEEMEAIEARAD